MLATLVTALAVVYTVGLLTMARRSRRGNPGGFVDGGRRFSSRQVFIMISALWCSSIFVVEMETGYLYGSSAIWFGLGTVLMALASGYLLPSLRRLGYLTSSGMIGERFGPTARAMSGLVIGVTFPIFAMSNVLAASAFLHVVVGWSLPVTLVVTAALVGCYAVVGGMRGLAATQTLNLVVMAVGMLLAVVLALHAALPGQVASRLPGRLLAPGGAGVGLIVTWVSSALLNVVNAQAEFQVLTAARDDRTGRRGLNASLVVICAFTAGSVAVGMAARAVSAPHTLGVVAVPAMLLRSAPHGLVALVALAVWASALSWSAPLLLSGASSLGLDALGPLEHCWRRAVSLSTGQRLIGSRWAGKGRAGSRWAGSERAGSRCVQACLLVQAALLVGYGLLRPQDLAWWRVFGQTIRTGALIGPTLAVLALPMVGRRTALWSMAVGAGAGLGWNLLTNFSVSRFALGVNPMWIGAAAGVSVISVSLLTRSVAARSLASWATDRKAIASLAGPAVLVVALVVAHRDLRAAGLVGPAILALAGSALFACRTALRGAAPKGADDRTAAQPRLAGASVGGDLRTG